MLKITKKIAVANKIFEFFGTRTFRFSNTELFRLSSQMNEADRELYFLDIPTNLNKYDYFKLCAYGLKRFVLKQKKPLEERLKTYKR